MHSHQKSLTIQDILIIADENDDSLGELNSIDYHETPDQLVQRLTAHIKSLVELAATEHKKNHCNAAGDLHPHKLNHITRLITHEFFFYTSEPLNIDQFQQIMQNVVGFCLQQPKNLHFILGSFAVLTPDSLLMNVVPQIEHGNDLQIYLSVKSFPDKMDPVYLLTEEDDDYVNIVKSPLATLDHSLSDLAITIGSNSYSFFCDNWHVSQTAGNVDFYSCLEVCNEHLVGVVARDLKAYLHEVINELVYDAEPRQEIEFLLPVHCVHTIVSNMVVLKEKNCLTDRVSHVDPEHSFPHFINSGGNTVLCSEAVFGLRYRALFMPLVEMDTLKNNLLDLVLLHNELQEYIFLFGGTANELSLAMQDKLIRSHAFKQKELDIFCKEAIYIAGLKFNQTQLRLFFSAGFLNDNIITEILYQALQSNEIIIFRYFIESNLVTTRIISDLVKMILQESNQFCLSNLHKLGLIPSTAWLEIFWKAVSNQNTHLINEFFYLEIISPRMAPFVFLHAIQQNLKDVLPIFIPKNMTIEQQNALTEFVFQCTKANLLNSMMLKNFLSVLCDLDHVSITKQLILQIQTEILNNTLKGKPNNDELQKLVSSFSYLYPIVAETSTPSLFFNLETSNAAANEPCFTGIISASTQKRCP